MKSKAYTLTLNGTCHRIYDDDIIEYDGKQYTGEQFYELHKNSKL